MGSACSTPQCVVAVGHPRRATIAVATSGRRTTTPAFQCIEVAATAEGASAAVHHHCGGPLDDVNGDDGLPVTPLRCPDRSAGSHRRKRVQGKRAPKLVASAFASVLPQPPSGCTPEAVQPIQPSYTLVPDVCFLHLSPRGSNAVPVAASHMQWSLMNVSQELHITDGLVPISAATTMASASQRVVAPMAGSEGVDYSKKKEVLNERRDSTPTNPPRLMLLAQNVK